MHLHEIHVTVAIGTDGKPSVPYVGPDITKAEAAKDSAGETVAEVGVLSHLMPVSVRYPAQEAIDIKTRAGAAKEREEAESRARQNEAREKREAADRLIQEAQAIEGQASPDDSESKTKKKN